MKPSKRDLILLHEIDSNSRQSASKMGKKSGISQQMVSYKLKNYLEAGLITSFYPMIDYSRFGYLSFRVFFKIHYINRERFLGLISKLSKEGSIIEVTECGGKYDVMLVFSAKNPSSFNKTMKKIMMENPELKNFSILTTVVTHNFPRKYLVGKLNSVQDTILGGDRDQIEVDDIDKKILHELQEDSSKSSVEISKMVKVNPKTVISRIKKLEQLQVIKGYRTLLHLPEIEHKVNKILLRYHNISTDRIEQLKNFCVRNQNITEMIKFVGEWDTEITVETRSMREFRNVFIQIRENFQDIIMDSETFPVFRIYKRHFLPGEFFA